MAQSVEWLLHKHEDLSLDPNLPCKSWEQWCIPVILAPSRWRRRILGDGWLASLANQLAFGSVRDLFSIKEKKVASN